MTTITPDLSIIIPLLNEAGNLELLHQKLTAALQPLGRPYEIIFINDGSTDGSAEVLESLFQQDEAVQVLHFRQNFGKTAGLIAGFRHSRGQILITLDADLQDDPAEIPAMLVKLNEGYDMVAAWRYHRQDPIDKTWPRGTSTGASPPFPASTCTISTAALRCTAGPSPSAFRSTAIFIALCRCWPPGRASR